MGDGDIQDGTSSEGDSLSAIKSQLPGSKTSRRGFLTSGGALAAKSALPDSGPVYKPAEPTDTVPEEPADGGQTRHFDVHAINVDIVFNRYGLHQPVGVMYALEDDLDEIRELSGKVPCGNNVVFDDEACFCDDVPEEKRADGDTRLIQPLTLRANRGDIIEIEFHNHLDRHASMHQTSLPYDVETSDGMDVGFNPDTTVPPGESTTYRWHAAELGGHFFLDGANQAYDSAEEPPQEANLLARGLFGTMVVLPQGTTWSDPYTGESGVQGRVQADVHVPNDLPEDAVRGGFVPGISYRQFLVHYHTPEGVVTADGDQLTFPDSDEPQMIHAINYRADPTGSRIPALDDDARELRESFYSSWLHGDPGGGDNVYPTYLGDPVKTMSIGASVEENHVHHLHGHRWKEIPPEDDSDTIDSQTVGLGAVYEQPLVPAFGSPRGFINDLDSVRPEMDFEEAFPVGAGGIHGSAGDFLFHCHLFPHYGEGMWGIMRVLDKEREGLQTLPTNDPPIPKDSKTPGYPEFIPGEFGDTAPYPPYEDVRDPTRAEREALGDDITPGAPYTDPCDPDNEDVEEDVAVEGQTREYTIVALPADVVYNDDGHHDPNGIVFVREEHADLVREGKMNPEPLVLRANVGDCVEITLKNEVTEEAIAALPGDRFPEDEDGNPESVPIAPGGKSNHIHFVSYDVLGSDSLSTGFNYRQDAQPGEQLTFRWFADEEGTIFFHDHITGIEDIMHGSFASLIVEPKGSKWLDPYTGDPIRSGTQAIIEVPDGQDFREFCVAYHDFAQLLNRDGELVNPDEEHEENAGVMALNYRNAPYYVRDDCDPAYVHSSHVHGDPSTPVFEAYEDDPVRFRIWQATYEEQHNFSIHGRRFEPEGFDPEDAVTQVMGTSEAFTIDLMPGEEFGGSDHDAFEDLDVNPAGLPVRDYVYGSTVVDDLWDGMWGLFRTFGGEVDHLYPLPDQGAPDERIDRTDLKEMGHPAPWSDFDWSEVGQRARLLYGEDDCRELPPDRDARQNDAISGNPPPQAPTPGDPCPDDATHRQFDVSAITTEIEYNCHGDHDPYGIVFALDEHVDDICDGCMPVTPLSLRVNVGDCIEVTLTNDIDFDDIDEDHAHPQMRTTRPWERSERISMHPHSLAYDVLGSDGATAGFNWDQTVGPGESITYRWYAGGDAGTAIVQDHADVRSNRHHGAYGQITIEDEGVDFLDARTAEPAVQGVATDTMLKVPGAPDRRNFALAFADSQFILNEDDADDCVIPPGPDTENPDAPCNQIADPEDQGYPAINYRSEPFIRRFDDDPEQWKVYDSETHGDPDTPIPRALLGDPVTFRVQKVADKARGLSFHLSDHQWNRFRGVEASENVGVDDRFTVGKSDRIEPFDGAGGIAESDGDFIYQEMKQRRRLEGGFWGIFRVRESLDEFCDPVQPLPDRAHEVPLHERPGWVVLTGDVTGGGRSDLVVLVPDSVHGPCDATALYLFEDVHSHREVTDLSIADHRAFVEVDDHDLVVTVDDSTGPGPTALLQMIRNTELTVLGCPHEYTIDVDEVEELEELQWQIVGPDGDESWELEIFPESVDCTRNAVTITWEDGSTFVLRGCQSLFD